MWILKFGLGIICGWLIISPSFWRIIFREIKWIFSHKKQVVRIKVAEMPETKTPEVKPKTDKDFSQMSREELAEMLRNSEVRLAKK